MQRRITPVLQCEGFIGQTLAGKHGAGRHDRGQVQRRQRGKARLVHAHGRGGQRGVIGRRRRQPGTERHFVGDQQVGRQFVDAIGDAFPVRAFRHQPGRAFHHADPHPRSCHVALLPWL